MFAQPSAAALNHLLIQSGWACARLQRFVGRTVRFAIAPFSLSFTILPDGTVRPAAPETSADVRCVLSPGLLPRLALRDEAAFNDVRCEGDAGLLEEIFFLARNLRWDVAEDLSHLTGDIAAERIVRFTGARMQHWRDAAVNLGQAAGEYLTEEQPLLAKQPQLADFTAAVQSLQAATDTLAQRIDALSARKAS